MPARFRQASGLRQEAPRGASSQREEQISGQRRRTGRQRSLGDLHPDDRSQAKASGGKPEELQFASHCLGIRGCARNPRRRRGVSRVAKKSEPATIAKAAVEPEKSSPQKAEAPEDATTPAKPVTIDISKQEPPSSDAATKPSSASDADAKKKSDPSAAKQTPPAPTVEPKATANKAASPEQIRRILGHKGLATSLAFSPDGSTFVSSSTDKRVRLWKVETGELQWETPESPGEVYTVAFGSRGKSVLAYAADRLLVIDPVTGNVQKEYPVVKGRFSAFSKGATSFAVFPWDKPGEVINTLNGKTMWKHEGVAGASAVAFRPEGNQVIFGWETMRLLDVKAGVVRPEPLFSNGECNVTGLAVHPNNRLVATGSGVGPKQSLGDCLVRLWQLPSGMEVAKFEDHKHWVFAVAFSPDGRLLASGGGGCSEHYGGYQEGADRDIRIWDVEKKRRVMRLTGHTAAVCSLCFSPDSSLLVSGGFNADIRLWRIGDKASAGTSE